MGSVTAFNHLTLKPGVAIQDFLEFSRNLDRPTCLQFDVVEAFDVFVVSAAGGAGPHVIERMQVRDWDAWVAARDSAPEIEPVVEGFRRLVDEDSVVTYLTHEDEV